jgi:trigger factor
LLVSEKKLENARMEFQFEIPESSIETEYKNVYNKLQKNAKLDGFRKGKAPLEMLVKKYKDSVDVEVTENIIKNAYIDALKEKELTPISEPEVKFDDRLQKDKPFKFNIKFDIRPSIELGDYKNISVKEYECKVADTDIDKEIQSLRERYATVAKKEKGENAEKGNYVRAEVKRLDNIEDTEVKEGNETKEVKPQNISMIVGKDKSDTSFDDDITGMKVDEEKEVTKKYPKDHADKDLAGKKVKYLLKIIEISNLTLPALDDEFAKDLGNFTSLTEVRDKIRIDIDNNVQAKGKKMVSAEIMDKIIENSKFDIPESIILREMDSIADRLEGNMGLGAGGLKKMLDDGMIEKDKFTAKIREDAIRNIKASLVLFEVAKVEKISASNEKYKEVLENYSKQANKTLEEVEKMVEKDGSRENIETDLVLSSTSEFIYNSANIKKQKPLPLEEFMKL